jgi:hypothetical protein
MSIHPKVFLSHSHWDRHTVTEIQVVLEMHGAETYLDQDRIQVADILPERIQEGINWCDTFLLIWSSRAARSEWVGKEWITAHELRKKIIPYSLDSTPLPAALQNVVRVEADDREHGDAKLLTALFGRDFTEERRKLFPGRWYASVDTFGIQGTYSFELRANGQMEGDGGLSNSGSFAGIPVDPELTHLLTMRIPINGSWSYDQGSKTLTITTSTAVVFGQQQSDTIRILTTGYERGAITGKDLAGRNWTLQRMVEHVPLPTDDLRQEVRDGFQEILKVGGNQGIAEVSPVTGIALALYCLGCNEQYQCDLGLPIEKARVFVQTQGDSRQLALIEFVQALERGGWIE